MSTSALAVLAALAEGTIDALRSDGDPGGVRPFTAALDHVRQAGALTLFTRLRQPPDDTALGVLARLERELLGAL